MENGTSGNVGGPLSVHTRLFWRCWQWWEGIEKMYATLSPSRKQEGAVRLSVVCPALVESDSCVHNTCSPRLIPVLASRKDQVAS